MGHRADLARHRCPVSWQGSCVGAPRRRRAFTLVEVAVVAAIIGIVAAISIPVAVSAVRKHTAESAPQLVAQALSRGRDAARDMLRCVTILVRGPQTTGGPQTVAAFLHDSASCAESFVDANNPGANATTVAEVEIPGDVVTALSVLRPAAGCVGLPPPVSCYESVATNRFVLSTDGTTDRPYRIRLTRPGGGVELFLVFPETGTIRFER